MKILEQAFFIENKSLYYLITNYHVISENIKSIEIEIWNESKIKLNLYKRFIKYMPKPKDITIIQINLNEIKGIQYLKCDLNYIDGYSQYNENHIFTIGYPNGEDLATGSGIIKKIIQNFEFYHNIPTKKGSSGSPIILDNTLKVIGIHKEVDKYAKLKDGKYEALNVGTFIGEIFEVLNLDKNNHKENLIFNIEYDEELVFIKKYCESVCVIKFNSNYGNMCCTGFFMKINSNNYLITNYHSINENIKNVEIILSNNQLIKLNLKDRIIKYFNYPKDITIIQIKLNEIKNIQYLDYDLNYKKGYIQYLNKLVIKLTPVNVKYKYMVYTGKIMNIDNKGFDHNIPNEEGMCGSPIILKENKRVIGIQTPTRYDSCKSSYGTFIGEIFNEIY